MRHLLAVCVSLTCAVPGFAAEQARQADAFVDSIGINTHLHYSGLSHFPNLVTQLAPVHRA